MQARLVDDPEWEVRAALACNPGATSGVVEALASKARWNPTLECLLENPAASFDVLQRILRGRSFYSLPPGLARHPSLVAWMSERGLSPDRHLDLTVALVAGCTGSRLELCMQAAADGRSPEPVLTQLQEIGVGLESTWERRELLTALALNPAFPDASLAALLTDLSPEAAREVASDPAAPQKTLRHLAAKGEALAGLLRNPAVSAEILMLVAAQELPGWLGKMLLSHPSLTREVTVTALRANRDLRDDARREIGWVRELVDAISRRRLAGDEIETLISSGLAERYRRELALNPGLSPDQLVELLRPAVPASLEIEMIPELPRSLLERWATGEETAERARVARLSHAPAELLSALGRDPSEGVRRLAAVSLELSRAIGEASHCRAAVGVHLSKAYYGRQRQVIYSPAEAVGWIQTEVIRVSWLRCAPGGFCEPLPRTSGIATTAPETAREEELGVTRRVDRGRLVREIGVEAAAAGCV
ncbi:MAG: hypothetical protein R3325_02850 [Thermoanaerobaculia bacterium]|nr:hypothetical protein [Thermoanaerobaculia bacterium]